MTRSLGPTLLAVLMLVAPATGQELDLRAGDRLLAEADLEALVRGQRLTFFDDGQAHFYNDGRYTYSYDLGRGGTAYGYFNIAGDSTICIRFLNGFARCDAYVANGDRLVMVTGDGDRFPIRSAEDAGPDPSLE